MHSGLLELAAAAPELLDGDVALVCEPTSTHVEAGCQGVARLRLELRGERAHTARPWRGRNAIHRLAGPIAAVAAYVPRAVELDGVTYTEQLQAVAVGGGVSDNVVPDLATLTVSQRVAPDRTCRGRRRRAARHVRAVHGRRRRDRGPRRGRPRAAAP